MEADALPKQPWDLVVELARDFGFSEQSLKYLLPIALYFAEGALTGIFYAYAVAVLFNGRYIGMVGVYMYSNPLETYMLFVQLIAMGTADGPVTGFGVLELLNLCSLMLSYALTAIFLSLLSFYVSYMWSLITGTAPLVHLIAFWALLFTSLAWLSIVDRPWTRIRVFFMDYVWRVILSEITGWILVTIGYCYLGVAQIWNICKKLREPLRRTFWLWRQLRQGLYSLFRPKVSKFYEYKPLAADREIRLLQLSRRLPGTEIEASLIHVLLEEAKSYDCISYTWGTNKETRSILIDNLEFEVSAKAYEILEDKASIWSPRVLWIDSICINQKDKDEKSKQVRLMLKIYQTANRVIASLGRDPDAILAQSLIYELITRLGNPETSTLNQVILRVYYKDKDQKNSVDTPPRWAALVRLFSNPWFERVWVFQEMVASTKFVFLYGGIYFDYDAVIFVLVAIVRSSWQVEGLLNLGPESSPTFTAPAIINGTVMSSTRSEFGRGQIVKLFEVLTKCINFKATDPRDKVFALQGITEAASHDMLPIDYSKTPLDVMLSTAHYFLTTPESLQVLQFAGLGWDRDIKDLPSWVVDWTQVLPPQSIAHRSWQFPYKATHMNSHKILPRAESNSVEVTGIYFDDIKILGIIRNYKEDLLPDAEDLMKLLHSWIVGADLLCRENSPEPYFTGQSLSEAFWRTLMGDRTETSRPAPPEFGKHFRKAMNYINSPIAKEFVNVHKQRPSMSFNGINEEELDDMGVPTEKTARKAFKTDLFDAYTYLKYAGLAYGRGRRFAITTKGYMCLVPPNTRPGDMVYLILGAAVPFVLRPIDRSQKNLAEEASSDHFLIGEAYVHGLMDGEIFKEEHSVQTLVLY